MKINKSNIVITLLSLLLILTMSLSIFMIMKKDKKIKSLNNRIDSSFFEKKSECNKIGNTWWLKKEDDVLSSFVWNVRLYSGPIFFYSSKLDSCLIGYAIEYSPKLFENYIFDTNGVIIPDSIGYMFEYYILDTFTNQIIKSEKVSNDRNSIKDKTKIEDSLLKEIEILQK